MRDGEGHMGLFEHLGEILGEMTRAGLRAGLPGHRSDGSCTVSQLASMPGELRVAGGCHAPLGARRAGRVLFQRDGGDLMRFGPHDRGPLANAAGRAGSWT